MFPESRTGLYFSSVFSDITTREAVENLFQNQTSYFEAPTCLFWGTQRVDEYDRGRERAIKRILRKRGIDFLREQPTYSVLVPGSQASIVAVLDGHHRTRYAPACGINTIPTLISEISALATALEKDPNDLASWISDAAGVAYESFSRRRDTLSQHPPYLDKEIKSVDQLTGIPALQRIPRPLKESLSTKTQSFYVPGNYSLGMLQSFLEL